MDNQTLSDVADWVTDDKFNLSMPTIDDLRLFSESIGAVAPKASIYRGLRFKRDNSLIDMSNGKLLLKKKRAESWTTDPLVAVEFGVRRMPTGVGMVISRPKIKAGTFIMRPMDVLIHYDMLNDKHEFYTEDLEVAMEESEIVVESQCPTCSLEDVEFIYVRGHLVEYAKKMQTELNEIGYSPVKGSRRLADTSEKPEYIFFDLRKKRKFRVFYAKHRQVTRNGLELMKRMDWKSKPNMKKTRGW